MNVITIDSGGSKIHGAVINEKRELLDIIRTDVTVYDGDFFVDAYCKIIETFAVKYDTKAVGIGCNGRMNKNQDMVLEYSGNFRNWVNRPICKELEEKFGFPVCLENDCRAAVVGEMWGGAADGCKDVLGLIVGTGLGGCYFNDSTLVAGWRNMAGEVGHGVLYPDGRLCSCGQRGCVERYISGTALWMGYNELSTASRIESGYAFFERIRQEDAVAKTVLERFIADFSVFLITCANFFDPQLILVGGGLADTCQFWWDDLIRLYRENGVPHDDYVPIVTAKYGNHAALYGMAQIALQLCNQRGIV